jgi:hypothetical protein
VSGTQISNPARVLVKSGESTTAEVTMQVGGGSVWPSATDGEAIDPAEVHLFVETVDTDAKGDKKTVTRRIAVIVAREGQATADGLLAGRHTAEVSALGTCPPSPGVRRGHRTADVVAAGRVASAGLPETTGIVGEDGRGVTVDTVLYVGEDGAEPTRRRTQDAGLLPVRPGSVILKAETADGRRSEQTLDVPDGATVPVEIRVTK